MVSVTLEISLDDDRAGDQNGIKSMNINSFISSALQIEAIPSAVFSPSFASTRGAEPGKTLEKAVRAKRDSKTIVMHTLTCTREGCKQKCVLCVLTQNARFIIMTYSNEAFHCVDNTQITETGNKEKSQHMKCFCFTRKCLGTVDSLEVSSATKMQLKYLMYIRRL